MGKRQFRLPLLFRREAKNKKKTANRRRRVIPVVCKIIRELFSARDSVNRVRLTMKMS